MYPPDDTRVQAGQRPSLAKFEEKTWDWFRPQQLSSVLKVCSLYVRTIRVDRGLEDVVFYIYLGGLTLAVVSNYTATWVTTSIGYS